MILILIISALLSIWSLAAYFVGIDVINMKEKIQSDIDLANRIAAQTESAFAKEMRKTPKNLPVNKGFTFDMGMKCKVLGVFFDQDTKYCTFCYSVNDKLIPLPAVGLVTDDNDIKFFSDKITNEVKKRAKNVYDKYKLNNKDAFIEVV